MDFVTNEYSLPVVKINFEELKAELEKTLKDYTGLVVTEETLPGSKAAQKELAALRNKIDTYRKDKKKELEVPIKSFENQCKELIALIEKAEKPIKEGIKVFDDQKREEKRKKAAQILAEVAADSVLNEKYTARLTIIDKYMNLTATGKAVREDAETRAFALKVEQDREKELLDIIQGVIDGENEKINTKLSMSDFQFMINSGYPTKDIIAQVKARAEKIYAAEHPAPKPEEVNVPEKEAAKEEKPNVEPEDQQPSKPESSLYRVVIEVKEPVERIRSLGTFLKSNNYNYTVISQEKN